MLKNKLPEYPNEIMARFEAEAIPHLPLLQRFAKHLTRNHAEAEDLLQDTFMQAFESFHQYREGTNCRAWLCKIMHNKYHRSIRVNARYCYFNEENEKSESLAAESAILQKLTDESIINSIKFLPKKFRAVVLLSDFYDFTYREAAQKLKIPIGTVMSRLYRGRKLLGEQFSPNYDNLKKIVRH